MTTLRRARRAAHTTRSRWRHLTSHPLTRDRRAAAVGRYLAFQLRQRIRPSIVEVPFVDGTTLLATRGTGGATDHLYVHLGDLEEMALLHHYLGAGDRFVDVGANVGGYSVLAAAAGAEVIACEPGEARTMLAATVDRNGLGDRIHVEPAAVGREVGSVGFTRGRDSLNRVEPAGDDDVALTTVDRLVSDRPPAAMKVDVEGYELEVLAGAAHTLADRRLRVVVLELNGSGRAFGVEDREVHDVMVGSGFAPHRYDPFERSLQPTTSWNRDRFNTIYLREVDRVAERVRTAPALRVGPHRL